MMRVLSMILLATTILVAAPADARCHRGDMCWESYRGGSYNGGYHRYGYGRDRYYDDRVVVEVERARPSRRARHLEREPGLIDVPLGILNFGLGLVFGRTVDTSCADDDVSCHRAEGRAEGRHDAKAAVADATEDRVYRDAYNETIRGSGQPVEAPAPGMRESDLEPEE